ncbi:MAG: toprim domain-containing protein [Acidihalobacter sp.]|uniref:toprim domain-containing protein n=1 Tax=Acidihalobacter sp. TaxID=1872108 RepID=UPI00307F6EAB
MSGQTFAKTREAARGRWCEILPTLGVEAKYLCNRHGACPGCGGKDRFRFDDREGAGTFFCSGGGEALAGDGFELLRHVHGWSAQRVLREVGYILQISRETSSAAFNHPIASKRADTPTADEKHIGAERMRKLFARGAPLHKKDEAVHYLRRRGLLLADFPQNLRCGRVGYFTASDRGPIKLGNFHAMLASIQASNGEMVGIHLTYIVDGRKLTIPDPINSNKNLPAKKIRAAWRGATRGAAVRLQPADRELVVAEGIETSLAAHLITGRPAWAALSAGNLGALELPGDVRDVLIAADADVAGKRAAHGLAERLLAEGRTVRLAAPDDGSDWLDALVEASS